MKIPKIIEQNKNSIILLEILIPKENNQVTFSIRGTGFIVSKDGKFITCAHVYKEIPENERQYLGTKVPTKTDEKGIMHYSRYPIEVLKTDEENDIILMKIVSDGKTEFSPIQSIGDSEKVQEGEEAVFLGYPLATELINIGFGITMTANRCIVSSVKKRLADGSLHFFIIDTHTNNGSSGSPVFSVEDGKVIGIVSGKISAKIPIPDGKTADIPANMGICRPSKYIIDLIK
ncbi:MAG: serine protease [bacterium]|nr:serine protease [bacterium]